MFFGNRDRLKYWLTFEIMSQRTVLIKDQGGRGRGLVANMDFKKGAFIAHYKSTFVKKCDKKEPDAVTRPYILDDERDGTQYIGDWKDETDNACLVNDACSSSVIAELAKCRTVTQVELWIASYTKSIEANCNAAFMIKDKKAWMIAAKHISKGDDILTAYGPDYWMALLGTGELKGCDYIARASLVAYSCLQGEFSVIGAANNIPFIWWDTRDGGVKCVYGSGSDKKLVREGMRKYEFRRLVCQKWLTVLGHPQASDKENAVAKWHCLLAHVAFKHLDITPVHSLIEKGGFTPECLLELKANEQKLRNASYTVETE